MRGITIWLTGKPSSGKSTIARELARGRRVEVLDGDALRASPLSEDLGFAEADRRRQARRVAFVAQRLNFYGVNVVVALVSPSLADRAEARGIVGEGFREVHVSCSTEECQKRDVKGLYARARAGELSGLTGFDAPYEDPEQPDVRVQTDEMGLEACVLALFKGLNIEQLA